MSYPDYMVNDLEERLNAAIEREKKLKEALEFYGNPENWANSIASGWHCEDAVIKNDKSRIMFWDTENGIRKYGCGIGGKLARQTLKELYGNGN